MSFPRYTAISVENRKKNSHPLYFASPLKGFPLELGIGAGGQKTRIIGLYWIEKKFDDIFSHLDTIHQRDRETDTGPQQRPRLRIAPRGNKTENISTIPYSTRVLVAKNSKTVQSVNVLFVSQIYTLIVRKFDLQIKKTNPVHSSVLSITVLYGTAHVITNNKDVIHSSKLLKQETRK